MDDRIIAIFCLCDDILKAAGHYEDPQRRVNDAEVMTVAIAAALFFGGNFQHALNLMNSPSYIPHMLGRSRFNRRLHAVHDLFLLLFSSLAECFKELNSGSSYIIDTFPVPVCDNIRIRRSKILRGESYRGYTASKKRYFYGVKIHLMITSEGKPVEFFLTPGSAADVRGLGMFNFDLPENSTVYGDSAYTDYGIEDMLEESAGIYLRPSRKKNSKRAVPPYTAYLQSRARKTVETAGSLISRLLPKSIHAVTQQGFELKIVLFILSLSVSYVI